MSNVQPLSTRTVLLLTLICFGLALGQVAVRSVGEQISPLVHSALRSAGACLLLYMWMVVQKIPRSSTDLTVGSPTLFWAILSGIFFGLEFVFLLPGVTLAGAARGTLLIYTTPFFVAIGAHFLLPNDKLTRNKVLGLSCAFLGVALVLYDRLQGPNLSTAYANTDLVKKVEAFGIDPSLTGDIACLLAAFFWSSLTLTVKATSLKTVQPERALMIQLIVSAMVMALAALAFGEPGITQWTWQVAAVLLYGIVIIATVIFLAWLWLMRTVRVTTLHTFTLLTPIFALALAGFLLGEPITPLLLVSVACVSFGIYLVNRP
jgi:drug/metabolite transporter (DMT)-like permease